MDPDALLSKWMRASALKRRDCRIANVGNARTRWRGHHQMAAFSRFDPCPPHTRARASRL